MHMVTRMHIRTRSQLQNGATLVAQSIGERAATADRDRLCGAASLSRRGWGHPPVIQADRRQDGEDAPVEHGHQVDKLVWWARSSGRWH